MLKTRQEPLSSKQLGMLIALASWAMMFGTLVLSFLMGRERFKVWPPLGTEDVPSLVPTLSTIVLLVSSYFIHEAYKKLKQDNSLHFKRYWSLGLFCGLLFLALQVVVWFQLKNQGLLVSQGLFASLVYTLIAFHAVHVLGALGALIWVLKDHAKFSSKNFQRPQLVSWFWHFMDVVWIIFFILLVWI